MTIEEKVDFNLEDAKNGAKVITDCGFSIKIISYDLVRDYDQLVGVLTIPNDVEEDEDRARISDDFDEDDYDRDGKYVITFNVDGELTGIVKYGIDVDLFMGSKINHFKEIPFKELQRKLNVDSFQIKILREEADLYRKSWIVCSGDGKDC